MVTILTAQPTREDGGSVGRVSVLPIYGFNWHHTSYSSNWKIEGNRREIEGNRREIQGNRRILNTFLKIAYKTRKLII